MSRRNSEDAILSDQLPSTSSAYKNKDSSDEQLETKSETTHSNPETQLPESSCFLLNVKGEIVGANVVGFNHVYCKYSLIHGPDWDLINGEADGFSQMACKNRLNLNNAILVDSFNQDSRTLDRCDLVTNVWNLPLEFTLSSTNVYGWPQLAISVYGLNFFGTDVIHGYGHVHVPPIAGRHELSVGLFRPKASSIIGEISSFFGGKRPEFLDFKRIADGQGRDVLRFHSERTVVIVQMHVMLKDFKRHGFSI